MHSTVFALAALVASVAADLGQAIIVNKCSYDVALQNTPAADGGFETITETISSNSYSQTWTELSNGDGWSMKLWPLTDDATVDVVADNIMQYEYTYDTTCADVTDCGALIWYDLSDVNGNPWDGNWEITADGDCTPKQAAYRFSTDDAYGMQSCPSSSSVTVTLCSGDSDDSSSSAVSSAAASTVVSSSSSSAYSAASVSSSTAETTAASTTAAPSTTSIGTSSTTGHHHPWTGAVDKAVVAATTLVTSAASTTSAGDPLMVTVTEIDTVIATATVIVEKRAEHVHQHQHIGRHPHGRH